MRVKRLSVVGVFSLITVFMSALVPLSVHAEADQAVLRAMQEELSRSFTKLKSAGDAPLYFLSYRVYETESFDLTGEYGSLMNGDPDSHTRSLDVEVRVGSPHRDNTHNVRESGFHLPDLKMLEHSTARMPLDDDPAAIRTALWDKTDSTFKEAQDKYAKMTTASDVRVEEEDTSDDFSREKPVTYIGEPKKLEFDRAAWEKRIRELSALYRQHPHITESSVKFGAQKRRRYMVTSEGTTIQDDQIEFRIFTTAEALAPDGMRVWLYDGIEAKSLDDIPDDAHLRAMVEKVANNVDALRVAKPAEPFTGPAILRNKAAGVYFHEIFGHRIEGHRQKDESEGRTFTKMVGQKIMPEFISVIDDPTKERLGSKPLNGYYKYDDEGVPAEKVVLVDKGVLKQFLMGRSPVKGFNNSNGHGRSAPGNAPVARQGNLIVESDKRIGYEALRGKLVEEIKRQNKPYGLLFDEIAGGFTMTRSFMPQVFKLKPLRVWRVFADGKPDELLRGVDLVGTPLTSLEKILTAGDDDDVF
ncbi:MAG TPA: metallopeptidase TldD-related protein, partial [Chroococcales cyanobacterium]